MARLAPLIFLGLVCGVGAALIGGVIRKDTIAEPNILFEPQIATFTGECLEYERVKVPLQLRNESTSPMTIRRVQGTCGCMQIQTVNGEEVVAGHVLDPHSALPLQVTIDTGSRSGSQEFAVGMTGDLHGVTVNRSIAVRMFVRAAHRAYPDFVRLSPDKHASERVILYDGYPDPGIGIEGLNISHPDVIFAEAAAISPTDIDFQELNVLKGMKPRFRIMIDSDRLIEDRDILGYVNIQPSRSSHRPVQIRVNVARQKPRIELTAHLIQIRSSDLQGTIVRRIPCLVRGGDSGVEILSCPSFVGAEIVPDQNGSRTLELKIDSNALRNSSMAEVQVGIAGDSLESDAVKIVVLND